MQLVPSSSGSVGAIAETHSVRQLHRESPMAVVAEAAAAQVLVEIPRGPSGRAAVRRGTGACEIVKVR